MKRIFAIVLLLAFLQNPAHAQFFQTDLSVTGLSTHSVEQNYNPWTIHRKLGQYGLAGAGVATFIGSLAMGDDYFATTIIPVVGPWVTMARIEGDPNIGYLPGGRPLLIASGVTQGVFLIYFVISWVGESTYKARLSVQPSSSGAGMTLRYRF